MNRPPAFQFYPADWLDFKVQRMSFEAQGLYMKLLCFMWRDSKDQCSILDDDGAIARALGATLEQWLTARSEIQHVTEPVLTLENGRLASERLRAEALKQANYRKLQHKKGVSSAQARLKLGSSSVQPGGNSLSLSSSLSYKEKERHSRKKKMPEDFSVSDRIRELARVKRWPDPDTEIESFRDWAISGGILSCDWEARFRNWLRKATEMGGQKRLRSPTVNGDTTPPWVKLKERMAQKKGG